jgi:hypothetical protein
MDDVGNLPYPTRNASRTAWIPIDQTFGENVLHMTSLLMSVFRILLVLAVISLFVCTIPLWLIVLVVLLVFR